MPTIAYDFSDAQDYADFVTLDVGNYVFKFKAADGSQKSKSGAAKVIVDLIVVAAIPAHSWAIGGLVRQHWPTTGQASGRFKAFMAALGIDPKAKGAVKLEKYYETEIGARVTKQAGTQPDAEGNLMYFNDLQGMMPGEQMRQILGVEEEDEEEAEDVEDKEEEEEEEEAEDAEEDEEEEADEDEEEDEEADDEEEEEEALTLDDLKAMSLAELKKLAKENDVSVLPPKGKTLTAAILVKRLSVLLAEEDEEGEEDPF